MAKQIFTSKNENDTAEIAAQIYGQALDKKYIFLHGPLGSGKSVFARGLVRALTKNHTIEVPSPTFSLVQLYEADPFDIAHFDLYRLKGPEELYELGWEDYLYDHIVIVEWPERLGQLKPLEGLDIHFSKGNNGDHHRNIEIREVG